MKAKKLFLILPLAALLFATQGQAQRSPRRSPSPGGASSSQDLSKCDLKPKALTKVQFKDKAGRVHHICTGLAVCGGRTVPVSCKIASQGTPCPIAKKCVAFGEGVTYDDNSLEEYFQKEVNIEYLGPENETDDSKYRFTTNKGSYEVLSKDLDEKLDEIEVELWPFPRFWPKRPYCCICNKNPAVRRTIRRRIKVLAHRRCNGFCRKNRLGKDHTLEDNSCN